MPKNLLPIVVVLLTACGTGGRPSSGVPAAWPGVVQAAVRWTVPFEVGGQVREVMVGPGSRVSAGQVIAAVDPAQYEAAEAEAANALGAAEGRLAQIGNYMRTDELRAFSPSVTADESMAALRYAVLDAEIGRAVAGTRARYAVRAREATALRTPEAGRITRVVVEAGATVRAGDVAAELEDDSRLEIVTTVRCRAIPGLRPGRRVGVSPAPGESLHGLVHRVGAVDGDGRCDVAVSVVERSSLPLGARVGVTFP
jgi:membrane fusion protein, multidrug efflux system